MSKSFLIINLLILIIKILTNGDCQGSGYEISDCQGRLTEEQINKGEHCCLLTGKPKSDSYQSNQCVGVEKAEFEDFDSLMNFYNNYYDNLSIDCISYYLNISILYFVSIYFLLT